MSGPDSSGNAALPLVVFTDDTIHPAAAELLAGRCRVRVLEGSYPSEERMVEACREAVAVLGRLGAVTRKVIEAAPKLRHISRHGIGVDAVDLDAATEHGILVTTTGSINSVAVAEHSFAMLLALTRKVPLADRSLRAGKWDRQTLLGSELAGKTLGILGLGSIGTHMARFALGFRMEVIATSRSGRAPEGLDVGMVSFDELLARSDALSIHLRLDARTQHIMNAAALAAMKPGAVIVNTSRGSVIDEAALVDALRSGRLGGVALDVFETEPLPLDSPLLSFPNTVLSPHIAGQTREAWREVGVASAQAILDLLEGRMPPHVYNTEVLSRLRPA